MNILLTGASGFLGGNLLKSLLLKGYNVTCIIRNPEQFEFLNSEGVTVIKGDITDKDIHGKIAGDFDALFHVAAFAKSWSKDPDLPYRVNVEGTENMLKIAITLGIKRFIHTSTAGVFGFSEGETLLNEKTPYIRNSGLAYIDTKILSEETVFASNSERMSCIVVNPTRIYGPGSLNESNSITRIINGYSKGKWRIIPGDGTSIGNYVFIDDVVNGHLLAMEKGRPGENYLLGGENIDFNTMFSILGKVTGNKRRMVRFSGSFMKLAGSVMERVAVTTNSRPLISRKWAERFLKHMNVDTGKATRELGYNPVSFAEGAAETIKWLKSNAE